MATGKHLFISYSRRDGDFALKLAQDLRSAGVDIWLDQLDIPPGSRWDREVDQALRTCGRLLLILSPESAGSENVMDEVAVAMHEGKPVVPVRHRPCEVPLRLMRLQHIDFTQNYDKGLNALLTHLREAGKVEPVRAEELSEAKAPKPRSGKPVAPGKSAFDFTTKPTSAWQRPMIYAISAVILIVLAVVLFKNFASPPKSSTSDLPRNQEAKATSDQSKPDPSKESERVDRTKETPSPAEPSTDRDLPTPLLTNEIRRLGMGEKVSHYYSLTAGPGELKITLDVEGGRIQIKLYNTDWKELLEVEEYAPGGSKRKVERVLIPRRQTVIMQVSEWLLYGDVVKSYLIRLEGAAQF